MFEQNGITILTDNNEIKSIRKFLKDLKAESVDYTIVNDMIAHSFIGKKCEFHKFGDAQICCIDEDAEEVYNTIVMNMILARKEYLNIQTNNKVFQYTTNQYTVKKFTIDIDVKDKTGLYNQTYKYQTIIEYRYDAGFKSSRDGLKGTNTLTNFEILAKQKDKSIILHVKEMYYYVAHGMGSIFWHDRNFSSINKYTNNILFSNLIIHTAYSNRNDPEYTWVLLEGIMNNNLPKAFYVIKTEDLDKAYISSQSMNKYELISKLTDESFIANLNDYLKTIDIILEDNRDTKEIAIYTTSFAEGINPNTKLISIIYNDKDNPTFIYYDSIINGENNYICVVKNDRDIAHAITNILYRIIDRVIRYDLAEIKDNL